MKKQRLKFKQLINKYRSLTYEDEFIDEVLMDSEVEFETYYKLYCVNNDIDIDKLNRDHAEKVGKVFSDSSDLALNIKEKTRESKFDSKYLFRDIAKKLHPDTLAKDDPRLFEFEEAFKKASGAIKECKWGDLFDVADHYDIKLSNYNDINDSLTEDIERIKEQIVNKKNKYAWILHECDEDNDCKDNLVKRFLNHLFNI